MSLINNTNPLQQLSRLFFNHEDHNPKSISLLTKLLFIFSGTAMSALLSLRGSYFSVLISVACAFLVFCIITFRYRFIELQFTHTNTKLAVITAILTVFMCAEFTKWFYYQNAKAFYNLSIYLRFPSKEVLGKCIAIFCGVISLFAIYVFLYIGSRYLIQLFRGWYKSTDTIEKSFLIIAGIISAVAIIVVYNFTTAFYAPSINGNLIDYDVVYTSDSANQLATNVYLNINAPENDFRQPLFGLFAAPFAIVALIISKLLFFIPNCYPIAIGIIQVLLLLFCFTLLARLLQLTGAVKVMFFIILTFTYPVLLYMFNIEQYIFALFWLLLFVYACENKIQDNDYLFIGATGTLLTSGILFPLLLRQSKPNKWVSILISTGAKFFAVITIFGQLPLFFNPVATYNKLVHFAGAKISFGGRMLQFFNFISSCIIKPQAGVSTTAYTHVSYQLAPVTGINIIGVILLVVAILGFVLNYKKYFAQVCMGWIIFSFLLLCILGWGTAENGLILYTLYFSWAYVSLAFMAIETLFRKWRIVKHTLYTMFAVLFALINVVGIYDLISFGISYYTV
ncbi:hypothetical protein [Acetanaerobacterium elongatum]|uniref:Dolichyl-phosphate-mannose-protein mannosyltransferase n=1 Tax=Acetanaerobacterium elongatum TaxID=258515 RepID=A0A1G9XVU1_9FIRM|nr:hypothetical protein [Acetanaerobacterium elongatum]SDN00952.1 hypothetical protein SAMN05192585_10963 [Acetanaerobacterium elongatum]